jgi:hypothetical protein
MERSRRGFSSVEVMIATVLLGLGICPILTMVIGTSREAGFTEAHMIVQSRAFTLLDCQEALGFESLDAAWEKKGDGSSPVELEIPRQAPSGPAVCREANGNHYSEKLTFQRVGGDLGVLTVEVSWVMGADQGRTRKPHVFRAFRLMGRPDGSWQHQVALPVVAPPAAD